MPGRQSGSGVLASTMPRAQNSAAKDSPLLRRRSTFPIWGFWVPVLYISMVYAVRYHIALYKLYTLITIERLLMRRKKGKEGGEADCNQQWRPKSRPNKARLRRNTLLFNVIFFRLFSIVILNAIFPNNLSDDFICFWTRIETNSDEAHYIPVPI